MNIIEEIYKLIQGFIDAIVKLVHDIRDKNDGK